MLSLVHYKTNGLLTLKYKPILPYIG